MITHRNQPAIQAWLDTLTPVQRHHMYQALNRIWNTPKGMLAMYFITAYDVNWLNRLHRTIEWFD